LQVDLASRELVVDGQPVRIGSRAFDMLAVLIAAKGELVSKNDMLKQVWPDTIVEENNLQVHMSALRKVLGESRGLIQTVSGRGYRLVARQWPPSPESGNASAGTGRDDHAVDQPRSAPAAITHNLPASFSPLIGRDDA
ncbi:winged helix-turn-helix domain-containing protein, partial [Rhizobium pusense]|nr:winged helix-turn-helix domain-containing protein [Agrobacterium pusense]